MFRRGKKKKQEQNEAASSNDNDNDNYNDNDNDNYNDDGNYNDNNYNYNNHNSSVGNDDGDMRPSFPGNSNNSDNDSRHSFSVYSEDNDKDGSNSNSTTPDEDLYLDNENNYANKKKPRTQKSAAARDEKDDDDNNNNADEEASSVQEVKPEEDRKARARQAVEDRKRKAREAVAARKARSQKGKPASVVEETATPVPAAGEEKQEAAPVPDAEDEEEEERIRKQEEEEERRRTIAKIQERVEEEQRAIAEIQERVGEEKRRAEEEDLRREEAEMRALEEELKREEEEAKKEAEEPDDYPYSNAKAKIDAKNVEVETVESDGDDSEVEENISAKIRAEAAKVAEEQRKAEESNRIKSQAEAEELAKLEEEQAMLEAEPKVEAEAKAEQAMLEAEPEEEAEAKKEQAMLEAEPKAEAEAKKEQARLEAEPEAEAEAKKEQARLEAELEAEAEAKKEQARLEAELMAEAEAKKEQARLEAELMAEADRIREEDDKARQEEEKRKAEVALLAAQHLFVETVPENQVDYLGDVPHDDVQNDDALLSEPDLDNLLETPRASAPSLDDLLDDKFDESVFNDSSSDDTAIGKPSDKLDPETAKEKKTMVSLVIEKPKAPKQDAAKSFHKTRMQPPAPPKRGTNSRAGAQRVATKSRKTPPPKFVTTTSKAMHVSPPYVNKNQTKSKPKAAQPKIFRKQNRRLEKPPASLQSPRSIDSAESHCTISTIPRSPLMPLSEDESCEVCDNTYIAKLHPDKLGCQVCIFKLSHAERDRYEKAGRHLRVTPTAGGCIDCKVFPSEADEEPVRLCKQCFFDTHLISMRKEKAFDGNGALAGIQDKKRSYSPGRRRYR